jgi:hypothetical protein
VASVFVSGLIDGSMASAGTPPPADPRPPSVPPVRPEPTAGAEGELLSTLRIAPAAQEGICDSRQARMNSCVEIDFDLHERAYLFVISTRDHQLVDTVCELPGPDDPGLRRFRLRLPPGRYGVDVADTGPDAGFYVLATRSRAVAQRLGRTLGRAPGRCTNAPGNAGSWLADLRALLARDGDAIAWRAVHLVHGRDGIAAL